VVPPAASWRADSPRAAGRSCFSRQGRIWAHASVRRCSTAGGILRDPRGATDWGFGSEPGADGSPTKLRRGKLLGDVLAHAVRRARSSGRLRWVGEARQSWLELRRRPAGVPATRGRRRLRRCAVARRRSPAWRRRLDRDGGWAARYDERRRSGTTTSRELTLRANVHASSQPAETTAYDRAHMVGSPDGGTAVGC
jgi:hypothetical protein